MEIYSQHVTGLLEWESAEQIDRHPPALTLRLSDSSNRLSYLLLVYPCLVDPMSTTPRPRSPLPDSPSLSLPTVEAPDSPDQPGPPPKLNSPSDSSSDSESDTPGPPKLNPVAESSSKSDFDSPTFAYEDESDDDRYLWRGEALFEYLLVRIDKDFHISLTPFASDQK